MRDFIVNKDIELVIFYHSAMSQVFSGIERSNCATYELAEMLARETGYWHNTEGVPGQITTGDAIDWLSKIGIAGAEIEFSTHNKVNEYEWNINLQAVLAFLNWEIPRPVMQETDLLEDMSQH